jgi:hypothetical protein
MAIAEEWFLECPHSPAWCLEHYRNWLSDAQLTHTECLAYHQGIYDGCVADCAAAFLPL